MSYSVSQVATCTQQAPSCNDAYDNSLSQTLTICGGLTYSVSDTPSGGTTALTSSELTVTSSGLITVATANAATVGSHTVTLLVKLTNFPAITLSLTMSLTVTACVVTSAQVFQGASPVALINKAYTISKTIGYSLQFSIV